MTPEQQRIAIAEACGWHYSSFAAQDVKLHAILSWIRPGNADWQPECLPDYLNDLNSMHEAEKSLTPAQWVSYWSFLEPLACQPNNTSILHATAAQRAEAFLRTLNLWKP